MYFFKFCTTDSESEVGVEKNKTLDFVSSIYSRILERFYSINLFCTHLMLFIRTLFNQSFIHTLNLEAELESESES